jgi:hypothetical protein
VPSCASIASFSYLDFDTFAGLVQACDDIDETWKVVALVQYRDQTHAKETQGEIGHHPSRTSLDSLMPIFGKLGPICQQSVAPKLLNISANSAANHQLG